MSLLVTGGASGIGAAIALRLAADGMRVVVTDRPGEERAERERLVSTGRGRHTAILGALGTYGLVP